MKGMGMKGKWDERKERIGEGKLRKSTRGKWRGAENNIGLLK